MASTKFELGLWGRGHTQEWSPVENLEFQPLACSRNQLRMIKVTQLNGDVLVLFLFCNCLYKDGLWSNGQRCEQCEKKNTGVANVVLSISCMWSKKENSCSSLQPLQLSTQLSSLQSTHAVPLCTEVAKQPDGCVLKDFLNLALHISDLSCWYCSCSLS